MLCVSCVIDLMSVSGQKCYFISCVFQDLRLVFWTSAVMKNSSAVSRWFCVILVWIRRCLKRCVSSCRSSPVFGECVLLTSQSSFTSSFMWSVWCVLTDRFVTSLRVCASGPPCVSSLMSLSCRPCIIDQMNKSTSRVFVCFIAGKTSVSSKPFHYTYYCKRCIARLTRLEPSSTSTWALFCLTWACSHAPNTLTLKGTLVSLADCLRNTENNFIKLIWTCLTAHMECFCQTLCST